MDEKKTRQEEEKAEEASQPLTDEKVGEAAGGYFQRPAWLPDMSHDEKVY